MKARTWRTKTTNDSPEEGIGSSPGTASKNWKTVGLDVREDVEVDVVAGLLMVVDSVSFAVVLSVDWGRGFLPPVVEDATGNIDDLRVEAVVEDSGLAMVSVIPKVGKL